MGNANSMVAIAGGILFYAGDMVYSKVSKKKIIF